MKPGKMSAQRFLYAAAAAIAACLPACGMEGMGASILNSAGIPVTSADLSVAAQAGGQIVEAAKGFTDEQEYYLGRGVSAQIFAKHRPLKNAQVNRYLSQIGLVLAGCSDRPDTFGGWHFTALDTGDVNAVSAPGGFVFVTRGFLRLIPDEDALAAVLAHEIGHVVKGHGAAAISQANLTSALTLIGKQAAASQGGQAVQLLTSSFGDSIKDITDTLLTKGYSRSQEYDADEYAAELLGRSGYDQQALIAMLRTLEQPGAGGGGWFATHPAAADRIDEVEGEIKPPTAESAAGRAARTARFKAQGKV